MGTLGTLLFVIVQATLSPTRIRHFRPVAFMEANLAASVSASVLASAGGRV